QQLILEFWQPKVEENVRMILDIKNTQPHTTQTPTRISHFKRKPEI
ncbi:14785_t:CDS:1, partial [Rhizophagus irregularis]